MAVPNTHTFTLRNITQEVFGDTAVGRSLRAAFATSDPARFDVAYGDKIEPNTMAEFRNYNSRVRAWRGIAPYCIQAIETHSVGDHWGGGVVAYILQSGDLGYDANVQHGIIADEWDLDSDSAGLPWWNGSNITTGATGTAIGTGGTNTAAIIAAQGIGATLYGQYAAYYCEYSTSNSYTDWVLPSINELAAVRTNKNLIGNFNNGYYHNSTEISTSVINVLNFANEGLLGASKEGLFHVRAIRYF